MFAKLFNRGAKKDSEFSKFIRKASSGEKKRVFMDVLEKAAEDQRKILKTRTTKTA